jgi:hypothetical protein
MTLWPPRWFAAVGLIWIIIMLGLAVSTETRPELDSGPDDGGGESGSDPLDNGSRGGSGGGGSSTGPESPSWRPTRPLGPDDVGDDQRWRITDAGGQPISFDIRGRDASVGVRVEDDGSVSAFPRPNGGPAPGGPDEDGSGPSAGGQVTPQPLRPDAIDDQLGYRVEADGKLEPVTADGVETGDLVIQPVDGGVDLVQPDGGRVEVRDRTGADDNRDGDSGAEDGNGGSGDGGSGDGGSGDGGSGDGGSGDGGSGRVTVTEVSPDGTELHRLPDPDGNVALDDGTTVRVPTGTPSFWEQARTTPWRWIVIGYAVLGIVSLGLALYLHLTRPEPFGPGFVGDSGIPASRFEEFLAMLAADPDPARAIRLAFAAAERGFGSLPPRQRTETPFEWSGRVGAERPDLSGPLTSLCSRFATARFAPERPTDHDRDQAVAELRQLAELGAYAVNPAHHLPTEPVETIR